MKPVRSKSRKRVHVTFSIPEEVNIKLHSFVEKRGLSEFATRALEKAIEEEQQNLKAAYAAANKDPDRQNAISDWAHLDVEGWDE